jgi:hypothetical protein
MYMSNMGVPAGWLLILVRLQWQQQQQQLKLHQEGTDLGVMSLLGSLSNS